MSRNSARRPSALKHGAFSSIQLFPWENQKEYDALHRDLREEWKPEGALEEEAVFTILTCVWRKRRIREKRNLETTAALNREDLKILTQEPKPFFQTARERSDHFISTKRERDMKRERDVKSRDKASQLLGLSSSLYGMLDGPALKAIIGLSGPEISGHIKKVVPRENFATQPEWVAAIKREIDEVMLPQARAELERPDHLAAKAAEFMTVDRINEDIDLEERLDAMMDRAIRRLAQVRMLKQISNLDRNRASDRLQEPKVIQPSLKAITANENKPLKAGRKSTSRISRKAK